MAAPYLMAYSPPLSRGSSGTAQPLSPLLGTCGCTAALSSAMEAPRAAAAPDSRGTRTVTDSWADEEVSRSRAAVMNLQGSNPGGCDWGRGGVGRVVDRGTSSMLERVAARLCHARHMPCSTKGSRGPLTGRELPRCCLPRLACCAGHSGTG